MKYLSIALLVIALGFAGYSFYQKNQVDELKMEIDGRQQEIIDLSGRIASYETQLDTLQMKNEELKRTILKLANDLSRENPGN
jgi:chromosome segregation ATPase